MAPPDVKYGGYGDCTGGASETICRHLIFVGAKLNSLVYIATGCRAEFASRMSS